LTEAWLNRIGTAVPPNDIHAEFVEFARTALSDRRSRNLFQRMSDLADIEHRFSCFAPGPKPRDHVLDTSGFYRRRAFPSTSARMALYREAALALSREAIAALDISGEKGDISHLIVASCTGFSAPGLDFDIMQDAGLASSIERTVVGFMGCFAAVNALKLARHIVRSEKGARVLVVALELCTLHLQETEELEQLLSFLIFADGCAAGLVSAEPHGFALDRFETVLVPESADQITWRVGDQGFDMRLSGQVATTLARALPAAMHEILAGAAPLLWAVHPGGRSILDAVERALALPEAALAASRAVLRGHGNMSSATILFVLKALMAHAASGAQGCALAFGPGLTAEALLFRAARGETMVRHEWEEKAWAK
jgi:predicted naringenin-chalcone synthase